MLRDIEKAPEFDQSALFKKVYEEEYGVFGGAPFGALIGDYEFGKHPEDMALLEGISHVAAQAHAPFVSAAAPDLFNLEASPSWMRRAIWRRSSTARNTPSGSHSGRAKIPVTLRCACHARSARLPYGKDTEPVDEFSYEEDVDGTDHSKYSG